MRLPPAALAAVLLLTGAAPPSAPLPPIVLVSRAPAPRDTGAAASASQVIPGFGPHARTLVTGGRLMIRAPDGALRALLGGGAVYDVSHPAVSWDGRTIAFAGVVARDSAWRIYSVNVDGTDLHALTFTDRALYRWKDAIEDQGETVVLMKTRKQDWTALLSRLHELHPYETPECVAVRVAAGAPKYMEWLESVLAPEGA